MSAEARYFRVGVFVFTGMLAIGTCAVVLGGGGLFTHRDKFETYFEESVQGLDVGSPVKMRGVRIGVVKAIGLADDYYGAAGEYADLVVVRMEASRDDEESDRTYEELMQDLQEDLDRGLRVRLASQGITGMMFIEADIFDPAQHPPREVPWEPEFVYVPSAPGTLATIVSAAERIFRRLEQVEVEKLVSNLEALLGNLADGTEGFEIGVVQREAEALLAEMRVTNAEAQAAAVRLRQMLDGGRYDLEVALENARVATENLRDLTETARQQPSLLLRSNPPPEAAPSSR